jgi:hypothetical protein
MNKNGICIVSNSKKKEWDIRLNILKNQIEYLTNPINKINKIIKIIQLFYNE